MFFIPIGMLFQSRATTQKAGEKVRSAKSKPTESKRTVDGLGDFAVLTPCGHYDYHTVVIFYDMVP